MTDEPTARSGRPASGAAARLAALLSEFQPSGNGVVDGDEPQDKSDTDQTDHRQPDRADQGSNGQAISALSLIHI